MDFDVYGPFTLHPSGESNLIASDSLSSLIEDVEDAKEGLSEACGCYIFGVRASKGIVPWYVGQANKTSLVKEALNPHNREKYNTVLVKKTGTKVMEKKTGTPVLFLLPKITSSGRFAKPTRKESGCQTISFLEDWLIANALQKNPEMINEKKTFLLKNLHVKGLINPTQGEATKQSTALKKLLGL